MSEYGSVSLVRRLNLDKDRLLQALDGKLKVDEDENGFIYEQASEQKCRNYIISVFDSVAQSLLEANQNARLLEKVMEANGLSTRDPQIFKDYQHFLAEDNEDKRWEEQYNLTESFPEDEEEE